MKAIFLTPDNEKDFEFLRNLLGKLGYEPHITPLLRASTPEVNRKVFNIFERRRSKPMGKNKN